MRYPIVKLLDWRAWNEELAASPNPFAVVLSQINTGNVGKIGLAWSASEGNNLVAFETDPVVVNSVMYYTTNANQVRAVNAATGKLIWQFTPKVDFYHAIAGGGGGVPTNRGVTVANGKVYLLTFDDHLISLQASTGEKLYDTQVADPLIGYSEVSPPTYWHGLLFVGGAEGDAGLRGEVQAFDAATGKRVWRWYTIPAPGQGWMPKVGAHGGGDVWMPSVIDDKTGILYFGTGNPSPDLNNSTRPGCNPWVDATVALNARTGRFIWAHSEVCNDVWDYDSLQPPILFNMTVGGKSVRAVGHGNKSGLYFIYDAATGKVLAQSPYLTPYTMPHLKPTAKGVLVCPGDIGGLEYSPPAYSPVTGLVYAPGLNTCNIFKLAPQSETNLHKIGASDFGGSPLPAGKPTGFMAAVDVHTGRIAWRTPISKPMIGGALATAGGLVFSGADDGYFYAFDARSGKIAWKANVGLGFGAAPMTFAVNGTQYIAVATGGAAVAVITGAKAGGTLAVFKLGGTAIPQFPTVQGYSLGGGVQATITTKGLTRINPWMYDDPARHTVTILVTAAATSDNNGFNFDGYFGGKATFNIPLGWTVSWIFTNKSAIPHSAALTADRKTPPTLALVGGAPVETASPMQGVIAGKTQYVSYAAVDAGTYNLVCLVPGHLPAGMWDRYIVSSAVTAPSLTVSK